MNLQRQIEITIKCPKCGKAHKKRIADLQRKVKIPCTCGTTIETNPDSFKSIGKQVGNLSDALDKLGK